MRVYLLFLSLFFCSITFAQNSITGIVTDSNNLPIPGANVKISGTSIGVSSDFDGGFTLKSNVKLPYVINVSAIGYGTSKMSITSSNQKINVKLSDEETKLDEIVVSASRTPERVLESPVTIERMGLAEVKNTTAASFYDGLENLKEVQFNTSSLTFKSINTRGFAANGNTRFMQLVDGMDNSSPALNFVLGNLLGISEVDVQSAELLPGASSALYGANAFNGIMFMTSRNPFNHHGISAYAKLGQTIQDAAGVNPYADFGVRMAFKANEHFAAKANITVMKATDWYATDTSDITRGNVSRSDQNYNGVNVYGDEVSTNLQGVGKALVALGKIPAGAVNLLPSENVSRTGYNEVDLTDNKIENVKTDFSLHYRPLGNENLEIIFQNKVGFGNTVYQGANRYMLKDFFMMQNKLEVVGKNFMARAYVSNEDAGNSYDMIFTGWNINKQWKDNSQWFGEYAGAFISAALAGVTDEKTKHDIARKVADTGRFLPGTPEFKKAFDKVTSDADFTQGSKFKDKSKIYHSDFNYNFKDKIAFGEVQVGGSARQYEMNSSGSIFTDEDGPIRYNEFGVYTQLTKKMVDDRLKLTASVRYDKSQNFDGNISPRVSLVYGAGSSKKHNFRMSYQTGFRNPTTQDQYIGLDLGPIALIGSAAENLSRYVEKLPVSAAGQALNGGSAVATMDGNDAYKNAYSASSVAAFAASKNPADLRVVQSSLVKPEQVQAFEVGYRSAIKKVSIDVNGYYNIYNDFISNERVVSPFYGKVGSDLTNPAVLQSIGALANGDRRAYQVYTNSDVIINSFGVGVGLSARVFGTYEIGANYNYAEFDFDQSSHPDFIAGFNTPKHKLKASLGNPKLFKNFGFNMNARWNSEYLWQSTFADGMIDENTVFDAQMSYGIPKISSVIKLGGTNLFGKEYIQVIGSGSIGRQWFVSWTINP
jgi:outer membrane cobalamin receptor